MNTRLFPYPHARGGERITGSLRVWPTTCLKCDDRQCEREKSGALMMCSYGLNYQRIDEDLLVAGVVVTEWQSTSQARRRRQREVPPIRLSDLNSAVTAYCDVRDKEQKRSRARRRAVEDNSLDQVQFKEEFLRSLQPEIVKGLSFVHDYKQINAQILQNINVIIEERYSGSNFEVKLQRAAHAEKAIYEAARFLGEKLDVAKFLLRPEWLKVSKECARFSVHKMIIKYIRIYESFFRQKGVKLVVTGSSYAEVVANPQACGVIAHTLIDNALKYAPRRSEVEVCIQDEKVGVYLEVSSLGPRIDPDERRRVFGPFYRGRAAESVVEEGAGYGLFVSEQVAREHLGTSIALEQEESPDMEFPQSHRTSFSLTFPPRAAILSLGG